MRGFSDGAYTGKGVIGSGWVIEGCWHFHDDHGRQVPIWEEVVRGGIRNLGNSAMEAEVAAAIAMWNDLLEFVKLTES